MTRIIRIGRCAEWCEWPPCDIAYRITDSSEPVRINDVLLWPIEVGAIHLASDNAYVLKLQQHKDVNGVMTPYDRSTYFIRRSDDTIRFDIGVVASGSTADGIACAHKRLVEKARECAEGMQEKLEEKGIKAEIRDLVNIQSEIKRDIERHAERNKMIGSAGIVG